MIGGVRVDLDGRTSLPGLYASGRGGRVGAARREPARVELAARGARLLAPHRARARSERAPRQRPRASSRPSSTPGRPATDAVSSRRATEAVGGSSGHVTRTPKASRGAAAEHRRRRDGARRAAANPPSSRSRTWSRWRCSCRAAAWHRTESRGCHSRSDYPERDDGWRATVAWPPASHRSCAAFGRLGHERASRPRADERARCG